MTRLELFKKICDVLEIDLPEEGITLPPSMAREDKVRVCRVSGTGPDDTEERYYDLYEVAESQQGDPIFVFIDGADRNYAQAEKEALAEADEAWKNPPGLEGAKVIHVV